MKRRITRCKEEGKKTESVLVEAEAVERVWVFMATEWERCYKTIRVSPFRVDVFVLCVKSD